MGTFAEYIAEAFHSEVCLNWSLRSTSHAVASFAVSSVSVQVSFEQREVNGDWHVGFEVVRGDLPERTHLAFRIFNGVFQAVREFIDVREPEVLVLVSKDPDLANIYGTYLRRERPRIEELGYSIEGPHRVDPYTQFSLRRVRSSGWKPQ